MKWSSYPIGLVCGRASRRDPRRRPRDAFLYVDIAGIDRVRKMVADYQVLLGSEAPSRARKVIRKEDILVSTVRPNLNAVAMVPDELDGQIASTGFCVLRPNRSLLEPRYLFYYVMTPDFIEALMNRVRGASYPAVTDEDVYIVKVPVAPLSEQRRIVEILDQADRLRRLRAEADAKFERILRAVFLEMFGDPETNTMGWPTAALGDLAEHITSGARGWARYAGEGKAFFVRTQDITQGEISTCLLPIDPPVSAEAERTRLLEGDVVVTITGVVGKAAVVRDSTRELYVSQHVALIRLRRDRILPEYLAAYANLPRGEGSVFTRAQYGQTRPGLGFRELRAAHIPLPPLHLQKAFKARALDLRRLRKLMRQSERTIGSLWDRVLQDAFRGSLTSAWREAQMKELLQEMKHQAKVLRAAK